MTHLLDTSASLANVFEEPGADRVRELLKDTSAVVGVSVLTLYETYTTVRHRTGSEEAATKAVATLREAVFAVAPVDEAILDVALELRRAAHARIATVDCLIAATAARQGATLVHRDPHFASLPVGRLAQETLPDKV